MCMSSVSLINFRWLEFQKKIIKTLNEPIIMLPLIKWWHHPNEKYVCLKANYFLYLIKRWWHKFSKFCKSKSQWAYNLWRSPCDDIIKIRKFIYIQMLISSVYSLYCWWNGSQMILWSPWCYLREDVMTIK